MGFEEYSKNKLVDTIHFMEILTLKDSVNKDTFFHKLPNVAEQLPCQIVLKRQEGSDSSICVLWDLSWFLQLLPLLTFALEFGYGASPDLTALLKMGSSLSAEEFSVKVFFFFIFIYIYLFFFWSHGLFKDFYNTSLEVPRCCYHLYSTVMSWR